MSKPRTLSPRMLEALVTVAKTQKYETRNFLPDFRLNTLVGLMSRGYIDTTEKGYVLTLSGQMYLSVNGHIVMDGYDTVIHVTTEHVSVLEKVQIIREYHLNKALAKFNTMVWDENGTFVPFVKTADDTANNVGRRCNIKGNGDTESRCWEVIGRVEFADQPTVLDTYLVRYVGTEWESYYAAGKAGSIEPYFLTDNQHMTNLY